MKLSLVPVLLFAVALAVPASAGWRFDFEAGVPSEIELKSARITDQADLVIAGSKSILADFHDQDGEWHEFLHTTPAVKLQKDRLYHACFRYRIVEPGESKARFYSLPRSRTGGDIYNNFWQWTREKGATGTIHRIFRPDKDDYMLILGVRKNGALVIDDLTIEDVTDVPIDPTGRVKPGRSRLSGIRRDLDQLRAQQGTLDLVRGLGIIMCNEGAGAKANNNRVRIVADFSPDFVDWNPMGPLAKEYGIRTSRGGPEYQEYYKVEGADVWDRRFQTFVGSGFAESLDGTIIQDETWGEGGYFTCHNGPNWHQYYKSKLIAKATQSAGICQDNIACATWLRCWGCFCEPCLDGFRRHLQSRYTSAELAKLGVKDVQTLNAREHFLQHGRWGFGAVEDPVVREYIKFQHITWLETWADVVKSVKEVSRKQGRIIPVYGNQIGAFGMWPMAVMLSQFNDIVEIEELVGVKDEIRLQSMYYKLGRASGQDEKPVWVRGPVKDETKSKTPMLQTSFWSVHFAEALANGGFRDFSLGMNAPWTGEPDTLDFMDDPALYSLFCTYAKFIDENRALFTHRESMARVALVYSLPTLMFRRFYPLDLDDNSAFVRVQETADLLDRSQIPYDAMVFGHSEIWDDSRALANLSRYDAIVLPSIDAISDDQVSALRKFVEGGGKIVVADEKAGTRDENFNRRSSPALAGVAMVDMNASRDQAMAVLKSAAGVTVEAPETVTVNVWRSVGGKSLDVHLLNYDVAVQKNEVHPVRNLQVAVKPPKGLAFDTAILTRPGIRRIFLSAERDGDLVRFTVPSLDDYAVVSLTNEATLNAANEALQEKRRLDRERVKQEAAKWNLY